MPITVFVADDKDVVLSSIRLLFRGNPEIRVVGEATTFQQTVQSAIELKPQVVVMDLHMPDGPSVNPEEIKTLLNTVGSRLIAISFWNDEDTQALAESLGAVILLDKMVIVSELIPAIKRAASKPPRASV